MTHQKVQSKDDQENKHSESTKQSANVQKSCPSIIQDILNLYNSRD